MRRHEDELQRKHAATSSLASGSWVSCELHVASAVAVLRSPAARRPGGGRRRARARQGRARARARRPRPAGRRDAARRRARARRGRRGRARRSAAHRDRRAQAAARRRRDHARGLRRAARGVRRTSSAAPASSRGVRETRCARCCARVEGIAARGQLTASRLAPLWLTLERNLEWWTHGPLLRIGQRVEFEGSELVWQYYPGQGLQLQMLGNFGKLNGLWGGRDERPARRMLDELLPLAAERARRPGVGVLLQLRRRPRRRGSAASPRAPPCRRSRARATAAAPRGRRAAGRPAGAGDLRRRRRRRACACRPSTATTTRSTRSPPACGCSTASSSRSIGLYDYARLAGDPRGARAVRRPPSRRRAREVPTYDTGAWSLYSRGSSTRESDLCYHDLLQGFLDEPVRADRRRGLLHDGRALRRLQDASRRRVAVQPRRCAAASPAAWRFELSKISTVTLRSRAAAKLVRGAAVRRRRLRQAHVRLGRPAPARATTRCS